MRQLSAGPPLEYPAPREGIDWKSLGFSLSTRDTKMVVSTCTSGRMWSSCRVEPYGALLLEPAATVLNYGQGCFEGLKAYRTVKGRIVLFRPHKNAVRMADGAQRLMMPVVPPQHFLDACRLAVRENADWVPPYGEGALYLRPMLFGSGADLGVKPSSEYSFIVYAQPVGQYFGPGNVGARMQLCSSSQRAAPAGIGDVKYIGNYAQCFAAQRKAKSDGFSDVIYLDVNGEYIEEAAASNLFCVDADGVVRTPKLGTILPGVTRDSIIQLVPRLQKEGLQLKVGRVTTQRALGASEIFVTGTAAAITPVQHISSAQDSAEFPCPGPVTQKLKSMLVDIQEERGEDVYKWLHDPFKELTGGMDSYMSPVF